MFRRQSGLHLIFFLTHTLPSGMLSPEDPIGLGWLSEGERIRFDRYRSHEKRQEFLASRLYGRSILAKWLDAPVESVSLSANGPPQLFVNGTATFDGISLSHSNGLGVYALSESGYSLGVDLEYENEGRSPGWEYTFLSESEFENLSQLHSEARSEFILDLWIVKESVYKSLFNKAVLTAHEICVRQRPETSECDGITQREYQVEIPRLGRSSRARVFSISSEKILTYLMNSDTSSFRVTGQFQKPWFIAVSQDASDGSDKVCGSVDQFPSVKMWFHSENRGVFTFEPLHQADDFVEFTKR